MHLCCDIVDGCDGGGRGTGWADVGLLDSTGSTGVAAGEDKVGANQT